MIYILAYCHPDRPNCIGKGLILEGISSTTGGKGEKNVFLLENILDILLSKALKRKKNCHPSVKM